MKVVSGKLQPVAPLEKTGNVASPSRSAASLLRKGRAWTQWLAGLVLLTHLSVSLAGDIDGRFAFRGEVSLEGEFAHGMFDFRIEVYDAATGGALIAGPLFHDAVDVDAGWFELELDFGQLFGPDKLWLEVALKPSSADDYLTLDPRYDMRAAPHALWAANGPDGSWLRNGNVIHYPPGYVSIGDASFEPLYVESSGSTPPFRAAVANNSALVVMDNAGVIIGGPGLAPDNGLRVVGPVRLGQITANAALAIDAEGVDRGMTVHDPDGSGALINLAALTSRPDGTALRGVATATSGSTAGIRGRTAGTSAGIGVFGDATSATGGTVGVLGRSDSPNGFGIVAKNTSATDAVAAKFDGNVVISGNDAGDSLRVETGGQSKIRVVSNGGVVFGSEALEPGVNRAAVAGPVQIGSDSTSAYVVIDAPSGDPLRIRNPAGTVLRVFSGNGGTSIGANSSPPANGLRLAGDLRIDPVQRWSVHVANTVHPLDLTNAGYIDVDVLACSAGTTCEHRAPVVLPDGAEVTELRAYFNDNHSGLEASADLRLWGTSGTATSIARVNSGVVATPGLGHEAFDTTIGAGTIDNDNFSYFLLIRVGSAGDYQQIGFIGARISYTTEGVTP
ncbi:MAG: hypothetical protein DHS20C11_18520 [Lysobacteraceae bacterium]|nr:MAG: hypothetical protein DHS20C11_18520 [Xanthomonadaceae bacterium]